MKVKDISRTANIAWSPAQQYPIFLAAGTAAQQLDATFSTTAAMEVFALNLSSSDMEMPLKGSVPCEHRFHKLVWGPYGMNQAASPAGMLVGGTDSGSIIMYNANKIISGDKDNVLLCENNKHTGPVQALDFNPFQFNLLATGASDSEIYIWDLNNPSAALTPGNKILPLDNISCLAWNRQVQHILASTSPCGRCVVWDLRKNEPIIKVSDNSAMIRCKAVEWHPDVATQMVLASEDDRYPVIQMWDLRFATSPMKVLEGHQRGILSIAWCPQDPDLLMSCAKDNRILCWNPNIPGTGGEIVYELPTTAQWSFDVRWCPRNPAMICTSSFDGHVSVFSLMGGNAPSQDQQKVNSAFDVDDPFAASIQHAQQNQQVAESTPLKKPPKWLRRPCGASFGFGGKLISFCQNKESAEKQVQISQVTTEAELVKRSNELEGTLAAGSFIEYCNSKIESSTKELERTLWSFLKNNFEKEPRRHFLALLGYDPVELSKKVASTQNSGGEGGVDAAELAKKMQLLTAQDLGKTGEGVFSSGATTPSVTESKTPLSDAGSEAAAAAFDAIASGGPLTINAVPEGAGTDETRRVSSPFEIPTNDETDGLISQALLTGNFEAAVEVCVKAERMADAFLLAIAGGPDLLSRIQRRYFEQNKSNVTRLMSVVINRDWRDIVESCVLENWREALAALVTYAKPEEFTSLCDLLGQRLEQEGDDHCTDAMVCYICAGNVDKFVTCWARTMPPEPSPLALQELIEKVMILKKAVERERRQMVPASSDIFVEKLSKYAELLAAQGCLETAIGYLMASNDQSNLGVLKDRLYNAQYPNHLTTSTAPPPFPFPRVDVLAEQVPQKQVPVQQSLQSQVQRPYGTATSPAQIPTQQVPAPSQQLYQPPAQQSFYNPAAYQGQAPQFPPPGSVGQSPYYSQSSQPIPAQSSWSQQQPPASVYQPSQGNVAPPQIPKSAPFSAQTQPAASEPQIYNPQVPSAPQIYNPVSSSTYGGPGPIPSAAPPVMAPPTGPTAPPSMGAPPAGSPPVAPMVPGTAPTVPPPTGLPQTNGPVPTGPPPAGPPPTGPPPISGAWTDTHAVRGRKPQQPAGYPPLAPITSPIFSPQQQPQTNQSPATGVAAVPQGTHGPAVSPLTPQGGTPPGGPPSYTQSLPPAQQQQEPPREVMKGPIPAEHIILQETFDSLVQRCRSTVNNPKTKRKLDEVDKRLEALYDKLREQKLSDQILENLHEIAQACQAADYPRGLMAHTSLISSGSFSEISNFMPGLKAMMQIATQLRV